MFTVWKGLLSCRYGMRLCPLTDYTVRHSVNRKSPLYTDALAPVKSLILTIYYQNTLSSTNQENKPNYVKYVSSYSEQVDH